MTQSPAACIHNLPSSTAYFNSCTRALTLACVDTLKMPFRPDISLLRVETSSLAHIDTGSVENLFGMVRTSSALTLETVRRNSFTNTSQWSLFSKTSHAMEDGKRLENLSWRLWNRETFCCAPEQQARSTLSPRCSFAIRSKAATADIPVPELSTSLESASSDDLDVENASPRRTTATTIPKARPELRRTDSMSSTSRGREKHITPIDLEKIVVSIKESKHLEPIELPVPTPLSKAADPLSTSALQQDLSQFRLDAEQPRTQQSPEKTSPHRAATSGTLLETSTSTVDTNDTKVSQSPPIDSDESSITEMSTHSIVRGFVPGGAPSSYRSQTHLAAQPTPILKTSPQRPQPKKKGPMFTIGTSSAEEDSSFDSAMSKHPSLLAKNLRRPDNGSGSSDGGKKQLSFQEEVAVGRAAGDSAIESDDEDEEVSESAIEEEDDEDSSEWEDSENDQSGPSSVNEKEFFQRVDSRPNLTSRRSLLTTMMHEPDRAKALANAASRSTPAFRRSRQTTPNGPSVATSPEPGAQIAMPGQQMPRSKPIIMTTSNTHQPQLALSPRTTRRNMLSTELTESLRKNLLWERQHRSTGNLAALKRRHTSNDVKNLKQHPDPITLSHQGGKNYTNDYFHAGLQEYHMKGW